MKNKFLIISLMTLMMLVAAYFGLSALLYKRHASELFQYCRAPQILLKAVSEWNKEQGEPIDREIVTDKNFVELLQGNNERRKVYMLVLNSELFLSPRFGGTISIALDGDGDGRYAPLIEYPTSSFVLWRSSDIGQKK